MKGFVMKRRSILISALMSCSFLISGCCSVPPEALSQASDNALIADGFVMLQEQGDTTRQQEQAFILANRRAWHAQNFAINDTPLPADLQPGATEVNLLDILQADPRVRAKAKEVADALQPDSDDGN
jgi:hypothetical protein